MIVIEFIYLQKYDLKTVPCWKDCKSDVMEGVRQEDLIQEGDGQEGGRQEGGRQEGDRQEGDRQEGDRQEGDRQEGDFPSPVVEETKQDPPPIIGPVPSADEGTL